MDHGVGSTDHFSALKIWMFENKFVSLPSHLKTIEPMARPIREKSGTNFKNDQENRPHDSSCLNPAPWSHNSFMILFQ